MSSYEDATVSRHISGTARLRRPDLDPSLFEFPQSPIDHQLLQLVPAGRAGPPRLAERVGSWVGQDIKRPRATLKPERLLKLKGAALVLRG